MASTRSPQLWVNHGLTDVAAFQPNLSLLQFLREQCALTGTKEGCGSGDCGACTVIVRDVASGTARPVNACITPLGAVLGMQVVTVEGVGTPAALHPVQQAMVEQHGSQCGFCTPGFVMAMVGDQLANEPTEACSREQLVRAVSGNLCRCTGYRPILAAAAQAHEAVRRGRAADRVPAIAERVDASARLSSPGYLRPSDEAALRSAMRSHTDRQALPLIAGATDLWLEVGQQYRDFAGFIDVTGVAELQRLEEDVGGLVIGAGVRLERLVGWFDAGRYRCPPLVTLLHRFGSPQVRARATVGGNLANGSPIADLPPVLLALDAEVVLGSAGGARRTLALTDFYRGYRQVDLRPDEYLAEVRVPAADWAALQIFKISKREDDDISSTLGAFYVTLQQGVIDTCRIGFGGIAATPVRLPAVEAVLQGAHLDAAVIERACATLAAGIAPIDDVRASADYRRAVSANLLRKALGRLAGGGPATLDEVLAS